MKEVVAGRDFEAGALLGIHHAGCPTLLRSDLGEIRFMKRRLGFGIACLVAVLLGICLPATTAAAPSKAPPQVALNEQGERLLAQYSNLLDALRAELVKSLPPVDPAQVAALQQAAAAVKAAEADANKAKEALDKIHGAKGLVEHARGKWIGGAEKEIAAAEAALKKAATDEQRAAANAALAKWQANKAEGQQALQERQAAYERAKLDEPKLIQAQQTAQATLAQARAAEQAATRTLLAAVGPTLESDRLDAVLVKAAVLAEATPRGFAAFAQQGSEQETHVRNLLADPALMKQMLEAGGAKFGNYGRAMEIYTTLLKLSPKAREGLLQRLAVSVALEHAHPIAQSNPIDQPQAPATVDPVKRYLHYGKAFLAGELDPAFQHLTAWEYRLVVDCDAPEEILAWGREMLRNYRPDHIDNPDYGWRYSATVKTEVPYGSENVKCDLETLHNYQNIIKDGGICGRRAFFGRFILQSFGIPTWGVTQHKHAALSHWTPQGWVINLGAGFDKSWWDKDEVPRSGADFLLETQAREHGPEYLKVLRAQWISRVLGEPQYNDRKNIDGGFWSSIAHYQTAKLAATAVALGPLGQELAEANEPIEKLKPTLAKLSESDKKIVLGSNGVITIPAVAFSKPSGHYLMMKSYSGGMQLHATGGFKADYVVDVPAPGKYQLSARVVTVQEGQKILFQANGVKAPTEVAVPYTLGKWQFTPAVEVTLTAGKNTLNCALQNGSRGVTIKEFLLTPVK